MNENLTKDRIEDLENKVVKLEFKKYKFDDSEANKRETWKNKMMKIQIPILNLIA